MPFLDESLEEQNSAELITTALGAIEQFMIEVEGDPLPGLDPDADPLVDTDPLVNAVPLLDVDPLVDIDDLVDVDDLSSSAEDLEQHQNMINWEKELRELSKIFL